ncbi:MAG: hypothetical protein JKY67_13545, partial [Pseudomonadales bacterium]|nr:hypothetical protein [Pseudomonadales bacterium]
KSIIVAILLLCTFTSVSHARWEDRSDEFPGTISDSDAAKYKKIGIIAVVGGAAAYFILRNSNLPSTDKSVSSLKKKNATNLPNTWTYAIAGSGMSVKYQF